MNSRPDLDKTITPETFRSYYYLKEELTAFCRLEGLQTTGGKMELTDRISHFLATGEKMQAGNSPRPRCKAIKEISTITPDSLIEGDFICSEKHRAFFKAAIGKSFSFPVPFQNWLKNNAGKTYKDAIAAYCQILEDKKKNRTAIDKQFEYNTYIRDFFEDNPGRTLKDAIRCWKYKKSLPGHNRYEKTDLIMLG